MVFSIRRTGALTGPGARGPASTRAGEPVGPRTGWGAAGTSYRWISRTGSGVTIPRGTSPCAPAPPPCRGGSHPAEPIATPNAATPTPPAISASNGCRTTRRCRVTYATRGSLKNTCMTLAPACSSHLQP
ncbi:hypothetical protein Daura_49815 [Dactylosporangium aurantiacum]|uniref:Uncharacterized protein n=1 Tax=Dactylosporangium aurantiacum TaxID=35754 RepID=A0A9Q9IJY4_9ACTN|nr:hypothetical protein [Dactylosporangium aurantiacum]MDG6107426.1 hypothetical protein [Dactylosporangium aurantiacum]UWZ54448.1 hypothetical protein Daura_49815 [Dactylosporangium aurantiacum]